MKTLTKQRGAIGLFAALTLLLAILFAALAVDTGRLMMQHRHLQTVADMAALDAAGLTGDCGSQNLNAIQSLANESAARHHYQGEPLVLRFGDVTVQNGLRHFKDSSIDIARAIHVQANQTVPASLFAGGLLGRETTLSAEAVAERNAIAALSAGTTLLEFSSQEVILLNNLLTSLLGANRPIQLSAVSYEGIAKTKLTLDDLLDAQISAGTVESLLDTDLSVTQWLNIYADAVSNDVVTTDIASLVSATVKNLNLSLSDVINVSTNDHKAAAKADIGLFDLLMTTLMVANKEHAINLPLSVELPAGLLSVTSQLTIIEPPQIAIGPPGQYSNGNWRTQIKTAQIRLTTGIRSTLDLGVPGLVGARASIDLGLQVEVAQGDAWLQSIQCTSASNRNSTVTIGAIPGVASINLTQTSNPSTTRALIDVAAVVLFIPVSIATVEVGVNLPLQNQFSTDLVYQVDPLAPESLPQTKRADTALGASLGNLGNSLDLNVRLLGIINLPLLDTLLEEALLGQILGPFLKALGVSIIDPLLKILGIELGIIDVQLIDVEIDRPELKR